MRRLWLGLKSNIPWGLSWGVPAGILYAMLGGTLFVLGGAAAKAKYGVGLATVLGLYVGGGVGTGIVLGMFRPILRWRAGSMLAGIVVALSAAAIYTTVSHTWSPASASGVIVYGLGFGALAGATLWKNPPAPKA